MDLAVHLDMRSIAWKGEQPCCQMEPRPACLLPRPAIPTSHVISASPVEAAAYGGAGRRLWVTRCAPRCRQDGNQRSDDPTPSLPLWLGEWQAARPLGRPVSCLLQPVNSCLKKTGPQCPESGSSPHSAPVAERGGQHAVCGGRGLRVKWHAHPGHRDVTGVSRPTAVPGPRILEEILES